MSVAKLCISFLLLSLSACQQSRRSGQLFIAAPQQAIFEIFRVTSSSPLRLVAEQTATFNTPVALAPGRYLLLGDCSHAFVTIKAATVTSLQAYHLVFTPPQPDTSTAAFSVQCQRFAATSSRQHLHNRFSLLLLTPHKKLLVGTAPLTVDFNTTQHRQFALAALQVAPTAPNTRFFVFPQHSLLSATDSQRSGHWLYLLPGEYVVEFNGMRTDIALRRGEQKIIHPAVLHITAPRPAPHATAYMDNGRIVPFNQRLALPAGRIALRLMPDSQPQHLTLRSKTRTVVAARSLRIAACASTSHVCPSSPTLSLYRGNSETPFLTTGERVVYFSGSAVRVGVEGAPQLTKRIPDRQRQAKLELGTLHLQLRVAHSREKFSDLLRLEAAAPPLQGHSGDLSLTATTTLRLLAGRYRLAHFVTLAHSPGQRRRRSTEFTIRPNRSNHLKVTVYRLQKH